MFWLSVMEPSALRIHLSLKRPLLFVVDQLSSIPVMLFLRCLAFEEEFQIQFFIIIPIHYKLICAHVKGQSLIGSCSSLREVKGVRRTDSELEFSSQELISDVMLRMVMKTVINIFYSYVLVESASPDSLFV